MTKAEKIPKTGIGKGDPHGFNTTLIKRNAPAILTICLATALDTSTKGWEDSLLEKGKREIKEKYIYIYIYDPLKLLCSVQLLPFLWIWTHSNGQIASSLPGGTHCLHAAPPSSWGSPATWWDMGHQNRLIKWAEVQMSLCRLELKLKRCHIRELRETTF